MCIKCTRKFVEKYSAECPVCQTECGFRVEVSAKPEAELGCVGGMIGNRYRTWRCIQYKRVLLCNHSSTEDMCLEVAAKIGLQIEDPVNGKIKRCANKKRDYLDLTNEVDMFWYQSKAWGEMNTYYWNFDWTMKEDDPFKSSARFAYYCEQRKYDEESTEHVSGENGQSFLEKDG